MDAVLLARIQFAFTVGFHFIFPSLTLGLTLMIVIFEALHYRKNDEMALKISSFLIKILGLVFVVGVATGIVMEFSFGTNWSNYSRMVGDIFGAPLAAEAIFSFFLESVFLGVLLFGRKRVSPRAYLVSVFLVFFASHLSGLWIIIANSWMQTPAGYEIVNGRAMLTDFFAAALNHSTIQRYVHTIIAGWMTGTLFTAGIGAFYLLRERHGDLAARMVKVSVSLFAALAFLQFGAGHAHSVQVAKTQPEKMAAFEALWKTQKNAPLSVFGIPDESAKTTHLEIGIPSLLSLMVYMDPAAEISGLDKFYGTDTPPPPVLLPFLTYHVMIGLGSLFALMAVLGLFLILRKKLIASRWYLRLLLFAIPLPIVANEAGWTAAEVGRQPWAVFHVLRTADAVSVVVPAWQVLLSLIGFILVYALLAAVFLRLLFKIINSGPENISAGY